LNLYVVLKVVHVAAVVMFLGNITVGILWKAIADQTQDAKIIAHTLRGIILADRVFTIPGAVLIVAAGIGTALIGHIPFLSTGWVLWPIVLFIIAGIAFGPISRLQRRLLAIAQSGAGAGTVDWNAYKQGSASWNVWGMIALVAPLIALVIMIAKPMLPAFHL